MRDPREPHEGLTMSHGVTLPARPAEALFGQIREAASLPVRDPDMTMFLAGGLEAARNVVLEAVANGRLLSEIAAHYDVPTLAFHLWVEAHIDPTAMERAKRVGAESLMVAARTLRAEFPSGSVDAQYLNRFAGHCERVAERMDPAVWGPPKVAQGGASVVLNLNFGNGDTRTVNTEAIEDAEVVPAFGDAPLQMMEPLALEEDEGVDTPLDTPVSARVGEAVLRAMGAGL